MSSSLIHVVVQTKQGYAREDAVAAEAVVALTNPSQAEAICKVIGNDSRIQTLVVDHVPPGLEQRMFELGVGSHVASRPALDEDLAELTAAMKAAVAAGLLGKSLSPPEYLKAWEGMKLVLEAAAGERSRHKKDAMSIVEAIAQGWVGCRYDAAGSGEIDIGEAIRSDGARLAGTVAKKGAGQ